MLTSCELLFGRCEWNAWCNDSMGCSRVYRFGLALCLIGNGSHLESYERYCVWVLHGGCDTLFCVRLFIVVFAMFIWKSALPPFVIIFCVRAMTECYLCYVVRLLCMQYVARSPFLQTVDRDHLLPSLVTTASDSTSLTHTQVQLPHC